MVYIVSVTRCHNTHCSIPCWNVFISWLRSTGCSAWRWVLFTVPSYVSVVTIDCVRSRAVITLQTLQTGADWMINHETRIMWGFVPINYYWSLRCSLLILLLVPNKLDWLIDLHIPRWLFLSAADLGYGGKLLNQPVMITYMLSHKTKPVWP